MKEHACLTSREFSALRARCFFGHGFPERVDAGDDQPVEFAVPNVTPRAIEFMDMFDRRVFRRLAIPDATHIIICRGECQLDLKRRRAEPLRQLAFRCQLVRHQVEDGYFKRPYILMPRPFRLDRGVIAERGKKRVWFLGVDDDGHEAPYRR